METIAARRLLIRLGFGRLPALMAGELASTCRAGQLHTRTVEDHEREMFRHMPWPFPDGRFPTQLGAIVQATVMSGEQPARLVIHSSDNDWLIGDGINNPNDPDGSIATHLGHALNWNSSLATLADLPPGWEATRTAPGSPWQRTPHVWLE